MNLNNFVIDRVVRAVGKNSDDEVLFIINQVTNPSLNVTSETAEAVDALGTPIAIFNRAKSCEFSAENALFDLNLMAVQAGTDANGVGSKSTTDIIAPAFDVFTVTDDKYVALNHKPKFEQDSDDNDVVTLKIYELNNDESLGKEIEQAADGTEGGWSYAEEKGANDSTTYKVSGLEAGKRIVVVYEYDATNAIQVVNSATKFPKACELILEVLGCDVCDQDELIYAYLIFPNFKISPDFDWSIATDGTHPFSGRAMQDYCDAEKVLYKLVIVGDDE